MSERFTGIQHLDDSHDGDEEEWYVPPPNFWIGRGPAARAIAWVLIGIGIIDMVMAACGTFLDSAQIMPLLETPEMRTAFGHVNEEELKTAVNLIGWVGGGVVLLLGIFSLWWDAILSRPRRRPKLPGHYRPLDHLARGNRKNW